MHWLNECSSKKIRNINNAFFLEIHSSLDIDRGILIIDKFPFIPINLSFP